ncbi:MAG: carboxypeptidase regulatory-like domain-containing protein, partial [Bryobacterales bacterium]|nr:carboxypeptidase regulatory-like domain-containing protein [Bryobacterales bacterium]
MNGTIAKKLPPALRACCFGVLVAALALSANGGTYLGHVSGVPESDDFDDVNVLLTGAAVLESTTPDADGRFGFYGLADGDYVVQVRKPGYKSSPARPFRVEMGGRVSSTSAENEFVLEQLDSNTFVFHWEEDQSTAGYDYSSHVNQPIEVEFVEEEPPAPDGSSANRLLHDYNISLVNDGGETWTHEHAYRLLQTMESIPQRKRDPYEVQSLPASRWIIASEHVENDIRIQGGDSGGPATVRIAADAFVHARPRIARIEGRRGAYYSQRLHHAVVRFVTGNGRDVDACEKILQERFGVTTRITEHTTYEALTANTTNEPASRFQAFHAEEIVQIINTFEEMPAGMHATPGLRYLARRLDGTPHPLYPMAPAVAWTGSGYIEFMEKAFTTPSILYVHRLIIHEKAHFLWAHLFDEQLKQDWILLGGWYRDANDPEGWSTTKQTEFVSAYAHGKNPNEDMAESIAYFVVNPDKLRSRSPGKYEFIRDRIMQGNIYISRIREDLTFEVYNLYPDYVYPGKIRRVDIEVTGGPEEDKNVRVEIELHALDGVLEGATRAFARVFS